MLALLKKAYNVSKSLAIAAVLVAEAEASGGPAGVPAPLGTSPYRHVIRLRELVATLELAPHLLGENRSQLDRLVAGL